ncbi:unnamed protein product [Aphanomyces euteiches]|nr:hypothetical protein AeRB84_019546 [Aphanomyces euteiches]
MRIIFPLIFAAAAFAFGVAADTSFDGKPIGHGFPGGRPMGHFGGGGAPHSVADAQQDAGQADEVNRLLPDKKRGGGKSGGNNSRGGKPREKKTSEIFRESRRQGQRDRPGVRRGTMSVSKAAPGWISSLTKKDLQGFRFN